MIGVVLCGGQSRRMGTDKGLLMQAGETWANIMKQKLCFFNIPVVFSVNSGQQNAYSDLFGSENLVVDQPLAITGPLSGILSAHYSHPSQDILVLACDMVKMDENFVSCLLKAKAKNNTFEVYVFTNDTYYEPLCGIYTAKGLQKIANLHEKDELFQYSMQYVLNTLITYSIPIAEEEKIKFSNFNSPEDLR
jgi:molybdopterin-guanine dinucleotide biosynthesis protein A